MRKKKQTNRTHRPIYQLDKAAPDSSWIRPQRMHSQDTPPNKTTVKAWYVCATWNLRESCGSRDDAQTSNRTMETENWSASHGGWRTGSDAGKGVGLRGAGDTHGGGGGVLFVVHMQNHDDVHGTCQHRVWSPLLLRSARPPSHNNTGRRSVRWGAELGIGDEDGLTLRLLA